MAIEDDSRTQAMAVRNDSSIAQPDEKRAKMYGHSQGFAQDKIRGVLTEDQKPKYDAMSGGAAAADAESRGGGADASPAPHL